MAVDPVIHAHMAYLVQCEKKDREVAEKLEDDIALWKKRVGLARERGEGELAEQARERALASESSVSPASRLPASDEVASGALLSSSAPLIASNIAQPELPSEKSKIVSARR